MKTVKILVLTKKVKFALNQQFFLSVILVIQKNLPRPQKMAGFFRVIWVILTMTVTFLSLNA